MIAEKLNINTVVWKYTWGIIKEDIMYKTVNRYIKYKCGDMDLTSI